MHGVLIDDQLMICRPLRGPSGAVPGDPRVRCGKPVDSTFKAREASAREGEATGVDSKYVTNAYLLTVFCRLGTSLDLGWCYDCYYNFVIEGDASERRTAAKEPSSSGIGGVAVCNP